MKTALNIADEGAATGVHEFDVIGKASPAHPLLDDVEVGDVGADRAMPGGVEIVPVVGVVRIERAFRIFEPTRQRRVVIALDHDRPATVAADRVGKGCCFLDLILDGLGAGAVHHRALMWVFDPVMISAAEVVEIFDELIPLLQPIEDIGAGDHPARSHAVAPRIQCDSGTELLMKDVAPRDRTDTKLSRTRTRGCRRALPTRRL